MLDIVPGFGNHTPSTFFASQQEGLACLFQLEGSAAECDGVWVPVLSFVVAYIIANLSILGVIKVGNAVFAFLCMAVTTPLTMFAFTFPIIMGDNAEDAHWYHFVSLGECAHDLCA